MSLALRLPREKNFPDPLQELLKLLQNLCTLLTFDKVQNPLCRPRETISEHSKMVPDFQFLTLLT